MTILESITKNSTASAAPLTEEEMVRAWKEVARPARRLMVVHPRSVMRCTCTWQDLFFRFNFPATHIRHASTCPLNGVTEIVV